MVSRYPSNAARIASLRGLMMAARRVLGATRYSARIARIFEIASWTRANVPSSASLGKVDGTVGHGAMASRSSGCRPGSIRHNSSVMNGTTGCSKRSTASKQYVSTACAAATDAASPEAAGARWAAAEGDAASGAAPTAAMRGFTASTYQAARSLHANSKHRFAASSSRKDSRWLVAATIVLCLAEDPAVRQRQRRRVEVVDGGDPLRQLRQDEPPDIPQFVREVASRCERRV